MNSKSLMNNRTLKQFHVVLMTYYTRPIMWLAAVACVYFLAISSPTSIEIDSQYLDKKMQIHLYKMNFGSIFILKGIVFTYSFGLLIHQISSHFSISQSKTFPDYKNSHLFISGSFLFLLTLGFVIPFWKIGIPITKSAGISFGVIALHSCFLINRRLYKNWFFILFLYTPLMFAFSGMGNHRWHGQIIEWYIDKSTYHFLFFIFTGCITVYFAVKQISSSTTYAQLTEAGLNFSSYKNWMKSFDYKKKSKHYLFDSFLQKSIFSAYDLDKSHRKDRIRLWLCGSPGELKGHLIAFILALVAFGGVLVSHRIINNNDLLLRNERFPTLLLQSIFMHAFFVFHLWYLRLHKLTFDFIKPVDNRQIVKDLFWIIFTTVIRTVFLNFLFFISFYICAYKYNFNLDLFNLSLLYSTLILLAYSTGIYSVKSKSKYFFLVFHGILLFLIMFIISFNDSYFKIMLRYSGHISIYLILLSLGIMYLAYHKWQNMEWGAK